MSLTRIITDKGKKAQLSVVKKLMFKPVAVPAEESNVSEKSTFCITIEQARPTHSTEASVGARRLVQALPASKSTSQVKTGSKEDKKGELLPICRHFAVLIRHIDRITKRAGGAEVKISPTPVTAKDSHVADHLLMPVPPDALYGFMRGGRFIPFTSLPERDSPSPDSPGKRRFDTLPGDASATTPKPSPGKKKKMEFVEGSSRAGMINKQWGNAVGRVGEPEPIVIDISSDSESEWTE